MKPLSCRIRIFLFFLIGLAPTVHAHEGHDEDAGAAPPHVEAAPRATAHSEDFELVAVLEPAQLTLYLDRYADNAPVADARIEVDSGTLKTLAQQTAPGVYAVAREPFATAGQYPITFVVEAGEDTDLLSATLEVGGEAAAASSGWRPSTWPAWLQGSVLVLLSGAGVFLLVRQRYRNRRRRA